MTKILEVFEMVEKYVDERTFCLSEEAVRKLVCGGSIGIHYGLNNYGDSVRHILELRDEVLKDYPNMEENEMTIWVVGEHESIRNARKTTLFVRIPLEDYFKFRKDGKIRIL